MFGRPAKKKGDVERPKKKWQEELEGKTPTPAPAPAAASDATTRCASPSPRRSPSPAPSPPRKAPRATSKVFLDIAINGAPSERMVFELLHKDCPRTCENFRALCTGERGKGQKTGLPLSYEGCPIHRIVPGFVAQGGDFSSGDGTGGESIYGGDFEDENFTHRHTGPGTLSMANAGRNTNGSQFFITFQRTPLLDGKHVVFGRLISGMEVLRKIEKLGRKDGDPTPNKVIIDCAGEVEDTSIGGSGNTDAQADRRRGRHSSRGSPRCGGRSRSRERHGGASGGGDRDRARRRSRSRSRDRRHRSRSGDRQRRESQ